MFLEDVLLVLNGRVRLRELAPPMICEPQAPYGFAAPVCTLLTEDGERSLTQLEYEAFVRDVSCFDLFIDTTAALDRGRHRAGHRRLDGEFAETTLTPMQAAALIELIERGTALRPKEFHSVGVVHADKLIEKARQAVDVNFSRRSWRAFHTLRGSDPEAKRYQFRPPQGFRFAVIRPIGSERLKTGTERA